ncbi:hypothetical protein ACHHYP_04599 [Achlya hypogyna]|uniref:Uncharacterized protein n=1 Tax=Achlya hypogyna TaxID=1202772 RepID=A0A1V9Z0T6_ACHHY|nr:hypothetical protein ACHHYP_04599 [Achlya hypogyna]
MGLDAHGVYYPCKISEAELYRRCDSEPLGVFIIRQRWQLFGLILRLPAAAPASAAMVSFFNASSEAKFAGRTKWTLPVVLNKDLQGLSPPKALVNIGDLQALHALAQDRLRWKKLVTTVVDSHGRGQKRRQDAAFAQDVDLNSTAQATAVDAARTAPLRRIRRVGRFTPSRLAAVAEASRRMDV